MKIERLFLERRAKIAPDLKHATPTEGRYIAVGHVKGRSMFVAFVIRDGCVRPISARYMHAKEAKRYEKST